MPDSLAEGLAAGVLHKGMMMLEDLVGNLQQDVLGSCLGAPNADGDVQKFVEQAFEDAMTDVYVLDELHVVDPDADRPVLRGIFMRELVRAHANQRVRASTRAPSALP